jgi:flagellar hook-basal body complex protein FliE
VTIDASRIMQMRTTILEQNSALQRAAGVGAAAGATPGGERIGGVTGFADAMRAAVSDVNATQAQASATTEAYERGETTDIAAVMLARQQASVGFEATLQVRNKLLSAYKDIMSMPV